MSQAEQKSLSRRFACVFLPYLSTDRVRRTMAAASRPAALRPLVLTTRRGGALRVSAVCPFGMERGLRADIALGQAQALVPELIAQPLEPHLDQALLARLATWAQRFSPTVEPLPPDKILLDVTGCGRLFRGEEQLLSQVVVVLKKHGFHAAGAIADTVGAAYALATKSGQEVLVAPEGQASAYLAPLPPLALRIEPRTAVQLDELGVRSIGDLLMLPRSSLPSRFGENLVWRLAQALGEIPEPVQPHRGEEPPVVQLVFDGQLHSLPDLQHFAHDALHDLFQTVVAQGCALRRLDCVLLHERSPPTTITLRLARAGRSEKHLRDLLDRRLESTPLPAGVCGLKLTAAETVRWCGAQSDLFEPVDPQHQEAFSELIDRFAARLGYASVLRPRLVDDHQPECAFRNVCVTEVGLSNAWGNHRPSWGQQRRLDNPGQHRRPAGASRSRSVARRGMADLPSSYGESISGSAGEVSRFPQRRDENTPRMDRPATLLAAPCSIRVMALVPEGPPTWFAAGDREYRITRAWGPERIETGWWRGPDVRRDYFRVETDAGHAWVYYDARQESWYLHGWFQ